MSVSVPSKAISVQSKATASVPTQARAIEAGAHDPWYVYVMQSKDSRRKVYTGATNNPVKRQRQHKGELAGGAKTTTRWGQGNAEMIILIGPFPDTGSVPSKIAALSFEKKMKVAKIGGGISGRVKTLMTLLNTPGGHVTKNVNLNKYSLRVSTRLSRSDFVSNVAKAEHATLAYTPLFTYDVAGLAEPPLPYNVIPSPAQKIPMPNLTKDKQQSLDKFLSIV